MSFLAKRSCSYSQLEGLLLIAEYTPLKVPEGCQLLGQHERRNEAPSRVCVAGIGCCTSAVLKVGGLSSNLPYTKQDGKEVHTHRAIADALQTPAPFGNITTSRDFPVLTPQIIFWDKHYD